MEWIILGVVIVLLVGVQFVMVQFSAKKKFVVSVIASIVMVGLLWFSGSEGKLPFKVLLIVVMLTAVYRNYHVMRKSSKTV